MRTSKGFEVDRSRGFYDVGEQGDVGKIGLYPLFAAQPVENRAQYGRVQIGEELGSVAVRSSG